MPDVLSDDELNVLAAEYVLGTLEYQERKGASALLEVDPAFYDVVCIWEKRFGELHLMVESVAPDPTLWERIKSGIPAIEQIPPAIPSERTDILEPTEPGGLDTHTAVDEVEGPIGPMPGDAQTVDGPAAGAQAAGAQAADTQAADTQAADTQAADTQVGDTQAADTQVGDTQVADAEPAGAQAAESGPQAPALADDDESKRKLAELAALLPAANGVDAEPAGAAAPPPQAIPERDAEQIPRGFVPPPPMVHRAPPATVTVVRKGGRGWKAASLLMTLLALLLAGLIGAWRFIPEKLPPELGVHSVLNIPLPKPPPPPPPPPPRPQPPAPFDE